MDYQMANKIDNIKLPLAIPFANKKLIDLCDEFIIYFYELLVATESKDVKTDSMTIDELSGSLEIHD